MILVRNLRVQFGSIRPIDDMTVTFRAPVTGLIGPNGAGKTTFLNAVSGFVRPAAGEILLDDLALNPLSPSRRAALGVRRSFQTAQIVEDLTVAGNIMAAADNFTSASRRLDDVRRAMAFTDLGGIANLLAATLNLFQRRLLDIARALVGTPRVILLDEPGAGLSETESLFLRDVIAHIPAEFKAQVLLIDHDVELIRTLCAQTVVLDFGHLLAEGPTETVLEREDVRRAYLGEL